MAQSQTSVGSGVRIMIAIARAFLALAFVALIGAWIAEVNGGQVFGLGQQHLFGDVIALALLGIGCFVDAYWHAQGA